MLGGSWVGITEFMRKVSILTTHVRGPKENLAREVWSSRFKRNRLALGEGVPALGLGLEI